MTLKIDDEILTNAKSPVRFIDFDNLRLTKLKSQSRHLRNSRRNVNRSQRMTEGKYAVSESRKSTARFESDEKKFAAVQTRLVK
jgi:hypothetical protein